MHSVELQIPGETASPNHTQKRSEHGVQHYLYQALGLVTRKFFEETGLAEAAEPRLPQLMIELSCLRTERLFSTQPMHLEARLQLISDEDFTVDYTFWSANQTRELALWRSHHVFYDLEAEQRYALESVSLDMEADLVRYGQVYSLNKQAAAPATQLYR
jgi:hypothetical protein